MALDHGAVSIIGFVPAFHSSGNDTSGFAIATVRKGDPNSPSLFAIPMGIKAEPSAEPEPSGAVAMGANFQFKNGILASARILINEVAFWKKLGRVLLGQSVHQKDLLIDMLDPGFASGIKSIGALRDDGIDLAFLGGGDTTNIVIKFRIPSSPGLDFVLKFYPRIAFNTARFLNDMLASAKFHKFARLVAACDYTMETVQRFFHDSMSGAYFDQVALSCAALNLLVNHFFPFIHFIQFIPGNGDGGMPFWNSAINRVQNGAKPPGNDITDIASKLGNTVAEFHHALQEKAVRFSENGVSQYQMLIKKMMSQFNTIRAHLIEYQKALPNDYSEMISRFIQMLESQEIVKKKNLDEIEYQKVDRQYIHQDLHMGQLMFIDALKEFYILDLEGDPQLPWNERLESSPVERDIASLLRSLSYIKIAALRNRIEDEFKDVAKNIPRFTEVYPLLFLTPSGLVDRLYSRLDASMRDAIGKLVKALNTWERYLQRIITDAYTKERPISQKILLFFTLHRILNEISYEIKFRPMNFFIPCVSLLELVEK
nr:hypothetical protein [Candidatus Sigynarchaeum springense]